MEQNLNEYQHRIRVMLCRAINIVVTILFTFLWIVTIGSDQGFSVVVQTLLILGIFTAAALSVFFLKGDIFNENGKLEKNRIIAMTILLMILAQVFFIFAQYSNERIKFTFKTIRQEMIFILVLMKVAIILRECLMNESAKFFPML